MVGGEKILMKNGRKVLYWDVKIRKKRTHFVKTAKQMANCL